MEVFRRATKKTRCMQLIQTKAPLRIYKVVVVVTANRECVEKHENCMFLLSFPLQPDVPAGRIIEPQKRRRQTLY